MNMVSAWKPHHTTVPDQNAPGASVGFLQPTSLYRATNVAPVSSTVEPPSQETMLLNIHEIARAKRLRAEYGSWFLKKNGRWVLNDAFWAAWLCSSLSVFFDPDSDVFRSAMMPLAQSNKLAAGALVEPVGMILTEAAKALAPTFPTGELRDERIRQLIEIMKVVPGSEAFSRVQPPVE